MSENSIKALRVSGPVAGSGVTAQEATGQGMAGQGVMEKLPGDQRTAMESLLLGKSVAETARLAGVSRGTVYYWMKHDAGFRAAFNQWNDEMQQSARSRLMMMTDKAVSAMEKALEAGDARLALQLLRGMGLVGYSPPGSTDPELVKREMVEEKRRTETRLTYNEIMRGMGE